MRMRHLTTTTCTGGHHGPETTTTTTTTKMVVDVDPSGGGELREDAHGGMGRRPRCRRRAVMPMRRRRPRRRSPRRWNIPRPIGRGQFLREVVVGIFQLL
jgi:hypothetical protein